jgi:type I restriction enzyme S subunit
MSHYKPYPTYKESGVEWIGHVPEHWTVCKLNFRFSVELGKMLDQKRISGVHLVPYLRNQDVQWESINSTDLPAMDIAPDEYERYTAIAGDLLVCEGGDVGRAAIWQGEPIGYQKALHRLRPRRDDQPQFMLASLIAAKTMGVFAENDSKATISHLPAEAFRNYRFPFPPPSEQSAICSAFARETARIDALIAKKTGFIELLKEKRQAIITHAVTKGLDPNVKMKDSGVEWIGEVPDHWEVVPSTWLFVESNERAHADDEHLSATQKYGVIPLAEYERLEGRQVTHAVKNVEQRKHVEVDNFVISMRSFEGGIERVRARGCVRSSYVVLQAEPAADIDFFTYLLKSSTYIQGLQATSSFIRDGQDLSYANFRQVKMPAPSIAEQRAIAAHLDRGIARIDALTSTTDRSINLLRERRAALITAAVTGQIDLRGATATTTEYAA